MWTVVERIAYVLIIVLSIFLIKVSLDLNKKLRMENEEKIQDEKKEYETPFIEIEEKQGD